MQNNCDTLRAELQLFLKNYCVFEEQLKQQQQLQTQSKLDTLLHVELDTAAAETLRTYMEEKAQWQQKVASEVAQFEELLRSSELQLQGSDADSCEVQTALQEAILQVWQLKKEKDTWSMRWEPSLTNIYDQYKDSPQTESPQSPEEQMEASDRTLKDLEKESSNLREEREMILHILEQRKDELAEGAKTKTKQTKSKKWGLKRLAWWKKKKETHASTGDQNVTTETPTAEGEQKAKRKRFFKHLPKGWGSNLVFGTVILLFVAGLILAVLYFILF